MRVKNQSTKKQFYMKSRKMTTALLAILVVSFSLTSCKKTASTSIKNTSDSAQIQSNDEAMANKETDDVTNDVTGTLEGTGGSFAARPDSASPTFAFFPCDASITFDTLTTPTRSITITYNGSNCSGTRTRTGSVTISFSDTLHWKNAGDSITVTYNNLKITRIIDGKTLLINGSMTYKNVSGGLLVNLTGSNQITHTIYGNLNLTFDNTAQASWTISKQRTFANIGGGLVISTGNGPQSAFAVEGINRYGNAFTASITEPLVVEQGCGFRLVGGQIVYTGPNATVTTTFGLNASGNVEVACPIGFYYYEQTWLINGKTYTFIGAY
jgi:hypothetical protein